MAQGNAELLRMLGEIDSKQPYGTPLFGALARLMPINGMEVVCLRESNGLEVFLAVRKPNEAYAGQSHAPGSVIRTGEALEANVLSRLIHNEFNCKVKILGLAGVVNNKREARGHAICLVFVCEIEGESLAGGWYPVDNLPENMVNVHCDATIPMAVKAWRTGLYCPFLEY